MMRTLLGLFSSRTGGYRTRDRLRDAGFTVTVIEQPAAAAERSRRAGEGRERESSTGAASGATVGGLGGGVLGAIPGALLGGLIGHGLSEMQASRYERVVREGGIVLVVDAPELERAAQAEDILREGDASHVHTGETPTP